MTLPIHVHNCSNAIVIEPVGSIDFGQNLEGLQQELAELIGAGKVNLILDLSRTIKLSDGAIGRLLEHREEVLSKNGTITFAGELKPQVERSLKTKGVLGTVFPYFPTTKQADESFVLVPKS